MDNEIEKLQIDLLHSFDKDVDYIPDFISGRKFTHKKCYDLSVELFKQLRTLFVAEVLPKKYITKVFLDIMSIINEMFEIDSLVAAEYYNLTIDMTHFYKNNCIANELFETAENLNEFENLYKKKFGKNE